MPGLFELIGRYAWAVFMAVNVANYFIAKSRRHLRNDKDEAWKVEGDMYARRFLMFNILPWLVVGLGQAVGSVPNIWHLFRPQERNPFVWTFYGTVFLSACALTGWVFLADGASKVVDLDLLQLSGIRGRVPLTEFKVKLFAAFAPFFAVAWVLLVAWQNYPLPG